MEEHPEVVGMGLAPAPAPAPSAGFTLRQLSLKGATDTVYICHRRERSTPLVVCSSRALTQTSARPRVPLVAVQGRNKIQLHEVEEDDDGGKERYGADTRHGTHPRLNHSVARTPLRWSPSAVL